MPLAIRHELTVTPPAGTHYAVLQLLLTPQSGPTQKVESWSVEAPGIGNAGRFSDAYGNVAHLVNQSRPEGPLTLVAKGVVEALDKNGVLGRPGGEPVPGLYRRTTPLTKASSGLVGKAKTRGMSRLEQLHLLMARVGEALGVIETQTQMQANGAQTQSQGSKSLPPASDYAHAFIGAARALDIPARYVTGYLMGDKDSDGGFHAWAEAYDDRLGWIGFDAMLQVCPTDRYVRLASGLDGECTRPVRMVPVGEDIVHRVSVKMAE